MSKTTAENFMEVKDLLSYLADANVRTAMILKDLEKRVSRLEEAGEPKGEESVGEIYKEIKKISQHARKEIRRKYPYLFE